MYDVFKLPPELILEFTCIGRIQVAKKPITDLHRLVTIQKNSPNFKFRAVDWFM